MRGGRRGGRSGRSPAGRCRPARALHFFRCACGARRAQPRGQMPPAPCGHPAACGGAGMPPRRRCAQNQPARTLGGAQAARGRHASGTPAGGIRMQPLPGGRAAAPPAAVHRGRPRARIARSEAAVPPPAARPSAPPPSGRARRLGDGQAAAGGGGRRASRPRRRPARAAFPQDARGPAGAFRACAQG